MKYVNYLLLARSVLHAQSWEMCFLSLTQIYKYTNIQGIVGGSASKSALRQDIGYMVEKTYHDIAPYLGAFGAYLMPQ